MYKVTTYKKLSLLVMSCFVPLLRLVPALTLLFSGGIVPNIELCRLLSSLLGVSCTVLANTEFCRVKNASLI